MAPKNQSVQVTTLKDKCPSVTINGQPLPQAESTKYLGIHLDRTLTWKKHIISKRPERNLKVSF